MSDLRSPVGKALDDTIERLLKVMLRYAEDHRGPSTRYCMGLAKVIEVLMQARRLA